MRSGYRGQSGYYANNWPKWLKQSRQSLQLTLAGVRKHPMRRGPEFASYIVEAMETGKAASVYVNVLNEGLIDNLPQNGVVEVACQVDKNGVQPTPFGSLPTQLATLDAQHMAFHDLVVTSVLEQNREAAVHALMVDPLTAAVLSLAEIRQLFDEMAAVQADYLPEFVRG
jgi:alpha-galactosidase